MYLRTLNLRLILYIQPCYDSFYIVKQLKLLLVYYFYIIDLLLFKRTNHVLKDLLC
jgi:hypothetical protein